MSKRDGGGGMWWVALRSGYRTIWVNMALATWIQEGADGKGSIIQFAAMSEDVETIHRLSVNVDASPKAIIDCIHKSSVCASAPYSAPQTVARKKGTAVFGG